MSFDVFFFFYRSLRDHVCDNWFSREVRGYLTQDTRTGNPGTTWLMLTLISIMLIRMYLSTKVTKDRDEKYVMQKLDKKLQELNVTMAEASNKISDNLHENLTREIQAINQKYSDILLRIAKYLDTQRLKNDDREARGVHLILKYRSARLLQYGQVNAYLKSIILRLTKEFTDLKKLHESLTSMKEFANGFELKVSQSKVKSQKFMTEILQLLQSNALYEEDKRKCSEQLLCIQSTLESILRKDGIKQDMLLTLNSQSNPSLSMRNSSINDTSQILPNAFSSMKYIDPQKWIKDSKVMSAINALHAENNEKEVRELYHTTKIRKSSSESSEEDSSYIRMAKKTFEENT